MVRVNYGTDRGQHLDVYAPMGASSLPVLLFLHGGAWINGHLGWLRFMAPALLSLPAILVAATYRLAPRCRWPAQEEDAHAALNVVYRAAAEWGGDDPGRIVIGGHSAGAQLAAQARGAQLLATRLSLAPPVEIRVRPWYNPAQRSATFIVPGIVGILLTITMTLITSTAIVRERERGTLEQLIVTPIGKTSLMIGKLVPFLLVGYVQMSVVLALGRVFFHIPIEGSLLLLYALALVFIVASLGVGLLISTVARNQVQSMQLSFFFMLPNILLSGYIFPRAAMPEPAQWLGALLPLTWFLEILRGVLLKGVGISELWQELAVLTVFAVLLLAVSVRRFSKTLD